MSRELPQQMQVVEISAPGGPEVLRIATRPLPRPLAGEVLIKVVAAGVNGPDLMQRKGLYPPPAGAPDLPGLEVSGTIVAAGDQVRRWTIGDQLTALTNGGGYAEYCTVDARHCLPIPKGIELRDAASLPETFFTVWSNVFMGARLAAGETLLVHGGAGGIGTTAIQLGKAFGAKVVATDSPEARCRICRELGADRVIDYRQEDYVEILRQEGGANVILDIVGGPNIERNFKAATHDARIIQLAFALGSKVELNLMPVMLKRLTYTGSTLRTRSPAFKASIAQELEARVWPLIESGRIKPVVHAAFPLAEAAKAHSLMESGAHIGKIVLTVA
ncbi:MAG: NAD(P)H-quinone oxidoreductase [Betaproteobacteria bacterium]|nr:NAD(P)H-quinone oxidoreductase [Betaproteobacteria bacterium]MBI2224111.1 NAD(P)H-quinone oxidoreductase [Betaproteobacteria bacterium]MBI3056687.1 NAD(P)H-quinone oxidoreductase [Betaproteobacteria bacterium]